MFSLNDLLDAGVDCGDEVEVSVYSCADMNFLRDTYKSDKGLSNVPYSIGSKELRDIYSIGGVTHYVVYE